MAEPLEIARRLRDEFGMSVIPIGPDKKPLVRWQTFQDTKPTDDNLQAWFARDERRNVGIVTGKLSGVVVVDTDSDAAENWAQEHLPATPMMCHTAKGMHRYYRHPGVEVRNGARIKTADGVIELDVRGDGGYVVGPGSTHPSGALYRPPQLWPPVTDLPVFDPAWLQVEPLPRAVRDTPSAVGTLIPNGQRNAVLASEAGSMRRRGMSPEAIEAALLAENAERCNPPLGESEVREIARSIARYEPEPWETPRACVFLDLQQLLDRPDPTYLVGGRIVAGSLVGFYGPSGCGKTFVALDLALSVASGLPWLGARVLDAGPVAYIVAEGMGGIPKRARAWLRAHNVTTPLPLHTLCEPVLLNDSDEAHGLLTALHAIQPKLVVVDTLARCSSGDENSVQDTMSLIRNCDRIRHQTGATVLLVHHTGVNESRERGSTALRASCDAMFALSQADDLLTLSCEKQKDDEPFAPVRVALHGVPDSTSCVVRLSEDDGDGPLTPNERKALVALEDMFPASGASAQAWLTAASLKESTFYRCSKKLVARGYVRQDEHGKRYVRTDKPVVS